MKISAIVRADNGGLGTLSRMFADFLPGGLQRTASIARHEGEAYHGRFGTQNRAVTDGLTPELVEWLCRGSDVLLSFECWYGAEVPAKAHALGCKTVLVPMFECCPTCGSGLEETDLAVCPSLLDFEEMRDDTPGLKGAVKTFLPIPSDTQRIAFRQRERAEVFGHHQGHGGIDGRNGTQPVLDAWQYVKSPARLVVKRQPSAAAVRVPADERITVIESDVPDYWQLWDETSDTTHVTGDVFLHPHRWDGLSLPIQEACAAGLPVMTTRYWPFCDLGEWWSGRVVSGHEPPRPTTHPSPSTTHPTGWLPPSSQSLALGVERTCRRRICREFTAHETSPRAIAAAVDALYSRDIRRRSADVRATAELWSWKRLGPVWAQLFEDLVAGHEIPEHYPRHA
ncbi:MAG TPA: hypothetical protein VGX78_01485 [Pirellulales bacterium]|nr:hypothetical protein [Pirellulales bacterium]